MLCIPCLFGHAFQYFNFQCIHISFLQANIYLHTFTIHFCTNIHIKFQFLFYCLRTHTHTHTPYTHNTWIILASAEECAKLSVIKEYNFIYDLKIYFKTSGKTYECAFLIFLPPPLSLPFSASVCEHFNFITPRQQNI